MTIRVLLSIALAAVLFSCAQKNPPDNFSAADRDFVTSKFAIVRQAGENLKTGKTGLKRLDGFPEKLSIVTWDYRKDDAPIRNTLLIPLSFIEGFDILKVPDYDPGYCQPLFHLGEFFLHGESNHYADFRLPGPAADVRALRNAKYLAVYVDTSVSRPVFDAQRKSLTRRGSYRGEYHLFSFTDGRYYGAVTVMTQGTETLEVEYTNDLKEYQKAGDFKAESDFRYRIYRAAGTALGAD